MMEEATVHGPDAPSRDRLGSWKEIATYLNRGLRTVQRWEREEGLPARRHVHGTGGSVYAFKSELDAWLRGRERLPVASGGGAAERAGGTATARTAGPRATRRSPARRSRFGGGLALLLLGAAALYGRPVLTPEASARKPRLAVSPFRNLTSDASVDRIGSALTEETLRQMFQVHGNRLDIVAGSPRDRSRKPQEEGEGIDYVLAGSIRQAGDRLRVAAHLVREADRALLWDAAYDRPAQDHALTQEDLGRTIAVAVSAKLVK